MKECVSVMEVVVDGDCDLLLQIDNWGWYKRKQSRSSIGSKPVHPIICNGILFQLSQPGQAPFQHTLKYSPLNKGSKDNEIPSNADVDSDGYSGPTYQDISWIPDDFATIERLAVHPAAPPGIEGAVLVHAKGLAREYFNFVEDYMDCLQQTLTFTNPGEISLQYIDSSSSSSTKIQVKVCTICQLQNTKSSQKCADCKAPLDGINVYRAAATASAAGAAESPYLQWKPRRNSNLNIQITRIEEGGTEGKQSVKKKPIFDTSDPHAKKSSDTVNPLDPSMAITFLPAMPINPAGKANLTKLLDLYGEMIGLEDFSSAMDTKAKKCNGVKRQFALWGTDQGAYNRDLAKDGKYQRFLPVPDTFHSEVTFMRTVHEMSNCFMGPSFEGRVSCAP